MIFPALRKRIDTVVEDLDIINGITPGRVGEKNWELLTP